MGLHGLQIIKIAELAKKHDLFIIVDEVYREFIYTDLKHFSILEDERFYDHAILIDSTSKRYSLCGARIGFIVSKNSELIETCLKFALTRLSPPTLALIAANEEILASPTIKDTIRANIAPNTVNWTVVIVPFIRIG